LPIFDWHLEGLNSSSIGNQKSRIKNWKLHYVAHWEKSDHVAKRR
jgi:hypothetical protein